MKKVGKPTILIADFLQHSIVFIYKFSIILITIQKVPMIKMLDTQSKIDTKKPAISIS